MLDLLIALLAVVRAFFRDIIIVRCADDLVVGFGRVTAKKRMAAKLQAIKSELRRRRHLPKTDLGAWLHKVTVGYYQYHAIPGNLRRLAIFVHRLRRLWRASLIRRS